ncbi:hypothetical protein QD460_19335 [Rhizobium jaguaris]|uniref:Uncharacterized protein n=1 Tax=Rhizobium jaguaris TaxID=1312183 RepID=A0A387FTZ4_9HYPH|nr:hypothetical protein [Rhizobium jaguaris]AYG61883.1 hypothetical protein CCGE525_23745 [Rhizobium jaguaris]
MTSWRPPTREPDALRAALHDYLRNRTAQVFLSKAATLQSLGRAEVVMSNGRNLAIDLRISPVDITKFADRATIVFAVEGHAAENGTGYEVNGRIVLDRKTLAYLSIEVSPTVINGGVRAG